MVNKCGECFRFNGNGEHIGYPYGECGYCSYNGKEVYSNTLACSAGDREEEVVDNRYKTVEDLLQDGFEYVGYDETNIRTIYEYQKNIGEYTICYEVCKYPNGKIEIERV